MTKKEQATQEYISHINYNDNRLGVAEKAFRAGWERAMAVARTAFIGKGDIMKLKDFEKELEE